MRSRWPWGWVLSNLSTRTISFLFFRSLQADLECGQELAQVVEFLGDPVRRGPGKAPAERAFFENSGDVFIGEKHELLDQLVAFVVFYLFDSIGVPVLVDVDLGFGHVQIEAALGHALFPQPGGKRPELTHPFLEILQVHGSGEFRRGRVRSSPSGGPEAGVAFRTTSSLSSLSKGVGLAIGQTLVAPDDCIGILDVLYPAVLWKR